MMMKLSVRSTLLNVKNMPEMLIFQRTFLLTLSVRLMFKSSMLRGLCTRRSQLFLLWKEEPSQIYYLRRNSSRWVLKIVSNRDHQNSQIARPPNAQNVAQKLTQSYLEEKSKCYVSFSTETLWKTSTSSYKILYSQQSKSQLWLMTYLTSLNLRRDSSLSTMNTLIWRSL